MAIEITPENLEQILVDFGENLGTGEEGSANKKLADLGHFAVTLLTVICLTSTRDLNEALDVLKMAESDCRARIKMSHAQEMLAKNTH